MNWYFPEKIYKWSISIWKDAQCHWSSGKNKSILQWDVISRLKIWLLLKARQVWWESREMRTLVHWLVWMKNCTATVECSMEVVEKFWKMEWQYDPSIPLWFFIQKYLKSGFLKRCYYSHIYLAKRCKHPKCPLTDEWTKNGICLLWNVTLPQKKKNIMQYVAMNFEDTLSEIQSQKGNCCIIPFL